MSSGAASGSESAGAASNSGRVVVLTENAEEVSIAHVGVAFEHQLHELEQQKNSSMNVRAASFKKF